MIRSTHFVVQYCLGNASGENGRFSLLNFTPQNVKTMPHWELSCHETEQLIFAGHGLIWNWFSEASALPSTFFQRFEEAYKRAGLDFLYQLEGEYCFVLYDKIQDKFFAFRDRGGTQTLYYMEQDGKLFISPRAKQLYQLKKDKQLSLLALKQFYKFGFVLAPYSPVEGVMRLLSGECMTGDENGRLSRYRYWTPSSSKPENKSVEHFIEESRQQMWATLKRNLNGVEKVGVFLSGGLDSAVLAGMLAQLKDVETRAYTIGLDIFHPRVDYKGDMPYARVVAHQHELPHYETVLDTRFSIVRALCEAISTYDTLYVTPNMITKRIMVKQAYEHGIRKIITGSGASVFTSYPDTLGDYTTKTMDDIYAITYQLRSHFLDDNRLHQLFPQTEQVTELEMIQLFAPYFEGIIIDGFDSYRSGVSLTFGPEKIINLHHLIGEGGGVPVQMPYYDYWLRQFRTRIPARFRGADGTYPKKHLLIQAFRELLPETVITRKKIGYPSYYWYRGELDKLHDKLFSDGVRQHLPDIDVVAARRIFQAELGSTRKSVGKVTWGTTVLLLWYLHFVKGWDVSTLLS